MLQGQLLFVEANRITGENSKGKYDFTNIVVSDGFKSAELGTDNMLADTLPNLSLKKGDKIQLTVDYKRQRFIATEIKKVS